MAELRRENTDVGSRSSDEELMLRVQDTADEAAFGCLYDRHARRAYRVALSSCGDTQRAEEAVQEGFLSVWRRRATFEARGEGSFQAWLMRIVRHAAIDAFRRETNGDRPQFCPASTERWHASAPQTLEDRAVARSEAEEVRSRLARLPDPQAEVIALAYFGGLSHAEIAAQLALPTGTVKGRMRLGLEKLRRQIDNRLPA